jgi:mannose-6-phosphate isomerase-like protein (cupin superfamily)
MGNLLDKFLGTQHYFSDGLYAKQMMLPSNHCALSHKHKYSHLSVLASGIAMVEANDEKTVYSAPACIEIKAGVTHKITAIEDVVWYCIHATNETDAENIDQVLIKEN